MVDELLGDLQRVTGAPDADHRLAGESELHGVGDRDDLHHAGIDHPLDALPDRGLGQPHGLPDAGIRPAAVLLEVLDDGLGQVVELNGAGGNGCIARSASIRWCARLAPCPRLCTESVVGATNLHNIRGQEALFPLECVATFGNVALDCPAAVG